MQVGIIVLSALHQRVIYHSVINPNPAFYFIIWQEYRQGDNLYQTAQTEFLTAPDMDAEFESDEPMTWPTFLIDFDSLQAINREVKGWIWIYDTVVNYPLVQSPVAVR